MDIENMPLGEVRPADFPEVQRLLRIYRGKEAIVEVEDSKSVKTSYWDRFTLGSISVVLKGVFTSNIRGWKFEGHLEGGEGDDYDFNLDVPNRTWIEERLTEFGNKTEGMPYKIEIVGRKPVYAHGNW